MKRSHQQCNSGRSEIGNSSFQRTHKSFSQHQETRYLRTSSREYEGNFPAFRQPKEIGCFSKDSARQFHHDKSQLKFYAPPPDPQRCKFDLKHGYSKMIYKDRNIKEYLNNLLRWIMHNKQSFFLKQPSSSGCGDFQNSGSHFHRFETS